MPVPRLPLRDMAARHPGLTPHVAGYFAEAASVCLDRHHLPPAETVLKHEGRAFAVEVSWDRPDDQCKAAHANVDDATRDGAYACIIAAIELAAGLVAVARAETKTGADYYLAPAGTEPGDLENAIRLEVSGVNSGQESDVARRLRAKIEQAAKGQSSLPAIAGVIGFGAKLILLKRAV